MQIARGLIVAMTLVAGAARAQAGPPIVYDCDTAAGHFSELNLSAPAPAFTVTGRVQNLAVLRDKQYAPVARIAVTNAAAPGPSDEAWSGFEYIVSPTAVGKEPTVHMLLSSNRAKGGDNKTDLLGMADKAGTDFTVSYRTGEVTTTVAGKTVKSALTPAAPVIRLICSTGDFLFSNMRITPQP